MSIHLQQGQTQQQILSPQMRQGLELLQASSLELSQLIQQALVTNPVLEQTSQDVPLELEKVAEAENDHETLSNLDDEYREHLIQTTRNSGSEGNQEARDFFYNSIVAPKTLQQHLLNQLNLAGKPPAIHRAGESIIGNLDERGFLTETIEEIALQERIPVDQLARAVAVIQGFSPVGVGAANIKECLLIQLASQGIYTGVQPQIVEKHLHNLAHKKIPEIAKALGISIESTIEATDHIASLSLNPGAQFDPTHNPQILPDIIISFSHLGILQAHLTDAYLPHLAISSEYKDLLSTTPDSEVRKYLKENIREGRTLIKSLGQRQQTLLKIAEVLMHRQKDFFSMGPKGLKPLTMNQLAEDIGVHPTTVSRACTSKYVLTPVGIFELRYFFAAGVENKDGKVVSNTRIRDMIKEIIEQEDPKKPFSDSAIEKALKKREIKVARRTIAKYRDQLNILPSNLRKKF